jgi:hypothetical protein
MLEERIADRSLIRIIRKWLKAGVMEELEHWSPSTEGTPQGGSYPHCWETSIFTSSKTCGSRRWW